MILMSLLLLPEKDLTITGLRKRILVQIKANAGTRVSQDQEIETKVIADS